MKILLSFVLGFVVCISCFAKAVEVKGETLSFEIKDNKVNCNASGNSYTFSFKNTGKSFTLSQAPEIKPAMIEATIKKMADEMKDSVKKQRKQQPGLKVKSVSDRSVSLGAFSGKEASVTTTRKGSTPNTEYVQCTYFFLLWDGKMCWRGTYSCTLESEVGAVHNILKTSKRIK